MDGGCEVVAERVQNTFGKRHVECGLNSFSAHIPDRNSHGVILQPDKIVIVSAVFMRRLTDRCNIATLHLRRPDRKERLLHLPRDLQDRKSTRLNSSHVAIS